MERCVHISGNAYIHIIRTLSYKIVKIFKYQSYCLWLKVVLFFPSLCISFLAFVYYLVQTLRILLEEVRRKKLNYMPKSKGNCCNKLVAWFLYIDLSMLVSIMSKLFFRNKWCILSKNGFYVLWNNIIIAFYFPLVWHSLLISFQIKHSLKPWIKPTLDMLYIFSELKYNLKNLYVCSWRILSYKFSFLQCPYPILAWRTCWIYKMS